MLAEGIIEPKRMANGEKSRRMAVISAAALMYHSWIRIEEAWLTTNVQAFSKNLDYFRQQEMVAKSRHDAIEADVCMHQIANRPAPGLLPKDDE